MKRKKVLQAAKQRRKARLGGVFARAAERRKRFREKEPEVRELASASPQGPGALKPTNVSRGPAEGEAGIGISAPPRVDTTPKTKSRPTPTPRKTTTTTQPAQTTQRDSGETTESTEAEETIPPRPKQSDYQKRGRYGTTVDDVDAFEAALLSWEQTYGVLKGTDIGTGTGTTGTGTTDTGTGTTGDAMVDQTTRQQRITDTAARTEALAKGNFEESGITIPTADIAKTGVDAEGKPLTNLETADDAIETIADREATAAPDKVTAGDIDVTEGTAAQAKLAEGFDVAAFNDDIRSGVSKKFGTSVQAVENADGSYSLVRRDGSVAKKYPSSAAMASDIGLNARTYTKEGVINAAQVEAAKAKSAGTTVAAQGSISEDAKASASAATLTDDEKAEGAEFFEGLSVAEREAELAKLKAKKQESFPLSKDEEGNILSEVQKITGTGGTISFDKETEGATAQTREAITTDTRDPETGELILGTQPTGTAASVLVGPDGSTTATADQIKQIVGFTAKTRTTIPQGEAKTGSAATMVAALNEDLAPEITAAIVEDPATVTAQIDNEPVEVRAAVAALPTEALVSSQMTKLLDGIEEGKTPIWARSAVAAVEQTLAQRGLSASTIGRDNLFNVIIQSALPIAQSNAQALQARAAQNLSNEQQANLAQSTQDMQRRLANLANRQTAEGQTAQFAQQMSTLQSQFRQQAVLTSAEQDQQLRVQNLQNRQRAAEINAQNAQAMAAQNLGNEQQMELANLQIKNQVEAANMTAENQERLAEMNLAADFLSKNAAFKQQMELANLTNAQQTRLANLTALNEAGRDNLNAAQQTELANLDATMKAKITQANLANTLGIAQLNADQQRAIFNAEVNAKIDMAKFNDAQKVELANSKFMQTMTLQEFDADQQAAMLNATNLAQMKMQEADLATRVSIENAQSFLKMDLANLNNKQQAILLDQQNKQQRLLSDQAAENSARQFNASSINQVNQFKAGLAAEMSRFNTSQANLMSQFNASEANRAAALEAENQLKADSINAELASKVNMFDQELQYRADAWNAANAQAVEQSNIEWRRKANTLDTAAQNDANRQAAAFQFNLSSNAQAALWQEVRDQATFDQQSSESAKDRALNLLNAALGNDTFLKAKDGSSLGLKRTAIFNLISKILGDV